MILPHLPFSHSAPSSTHNYRIIVIVMQRIVRDARALCHTKGFFNFTVHRNGLLWFRANPQPHSTKWISRNHYSRRSKTERKGKKKKWKRNKPKGLGGTGILAAIATRPCVTAVFHSNMVRALELGWGEGGQWNASIIFPRRERTSEKESWDEVGGNRDDW